MCVSAHIYIHTIGDIYVVQSPENQERQRCKFQFKSEIKGGPMSQLEDQ